MSNAASNSSNDRRIDYIEFPTEDAGKSKEFYSSAFGWKFEDYGPQYTAFHDGRLAGGFSADAGERPAKPLIVLYAADLDAAQRAVEQAGGKIARAIFAFPGGRRFHFTDPSGNELAVWSE
jgi:predicted enzyme related to lactoylglutathione lyase